ncbi:uncharacterized protein ARMOST_02864 [Armillaria ostoyae]|uniref:F-box domain-containing protein n=1 Tax=Armillaria ostoyae TaxID=47428 RepID=A0A284QSV1_ARMOS|nr:uncharacterized protein ARMOST_02864 [Armillaria ostoyae]
MSSDSSAGKPQEIPPDIFYEIILKYGVKDLTFLWINCRQVSRNFKEAVERVFVIKHLKKTWIHIDPGEWYSEDHGEVFPASEFKFSRLDPTNPSRAIYNDEQCHEDKEFARRLRRMFKNGPSLERPRVIVQVRRSANDTMLPAFQSNFDPESKVFEISFDWKGMYSHFFREDKEVSRRMHDWVESIKDEVRAGANDPENGLGTALFMRAIQMYASTSNEIHKTIRSQRIQRNVLENEGREVSGKDDAGYQRVKEAGQAAGWEEPYSDEEVSGEEDEQDGTESEGDSEAVSEDGEGGD